MMEPSYLVSCREGEDCCSPQIPRNEKVHRLSHFNLVNLKLQALPQLTFLHEKNGKTVGNSSILDPESFVIEDKAANPPLPLNSISLPDEMGNCAHIGSAPTGQNSTAAFDLGNLAHAIEQYLPNNRGGSKAKPSKRA